MNTKVVLVTGAAQRIGAAIAQHCANAGWRVALHYNRSADAAERTRQSLITPDQHDCFSADFADEDSDRVADKLIDAVVKKMGRIDAIVNNASLFAHDKDGLAIKSEVKSATKSATAADATLDAEQYFYHPALIAHMKVNVSVPILLAQTLHRHLRALDSSASNTTGRACVVNLLDQKLWNPNPDFLSYSLSKAALQYATTVLAQAFAPTLRVCAVAPGMSLPSTYQTDNNFTQAQQHSLLGFASTPQDVAKAVLFLLETPSVTGSSILVDAGQHLMPNRRDVMFLAPQ